MLFRGGKGATAVGLCRVASPGPRVDIRRTEGPPHGDSPDLAGLGMDKGSNRNTVITARYSADYLTALSTPYL